MLGSHAVDQLPDEGDVVVAIHPTQDLVIPTLKREVEMGTDPVVFPEKAKEPWGYLTRFKGTES